MGNRQKAKGDAYERELAAYLNDNVYGYEQCGRAPLSGGGFVGLSGGADLIGTTGLFVEAKRVEKLSWREAVAQAERNATTTKAPETPIVVTRKSREKTGDSLVVMRLNEFNKYYKAWLLSEGYRTIPSGGSEE